MKEIKIENGGNQPPQKTKTKPQNRPYENSLFSSTSSYSNNNESVIINFSSNLETQGNHPLYGAPIPPWFGGNNPPTPAPNPPWFGSNNPPTPAPNPPAPKNAPKLRAKAVDEELLKKYNASFDVNDPNGKAQFVVGDQDGEVLTSGGTIDKPDYIIIKDNTNNNVNTYTYRKLTEEEIAAGKTIDGQKISKDQLNEDGIYYVLVSAQNSKGESIRSNNGIEVYKLNFSEDEETNTVNYDLIQTKGMDGSGKSSIDYTKRNS